MKFNVAGLGKKLFFKNFSVRSRVDVTNGALPKNNKQTHKHKHKQTRARKDIAHVTPIKILQRKFRQIKNFSHAYFRMCGIKKCGECVCVCGCMWWRVSQQEREREWESRVVVLAINGMSKPFVKISCFLWLPSAVYIPLFKNTFPYFIWDVSFEHLRL